MGRHLPATLLAGETSTSVQRETVTGARKRSRLGPDSQEEEEDSKEEEQERQVEEVGEWQDDNPNLLGSNIPP